MQRRTLLNRMLQAAGASLVASAVFPWSQVIAKERGQIRISEVRAFAIPKAVFVQVIADDGTQGWGEAGHEGGLHTARYINEDLDQVVEGTDVFDSEPTWLKMFHHADEMGIPGIAGYALSGIDNALWDLRGKLLGVPTYQLLGGKFHSHFDLYGSFSRDNGQGGFLTPLECARRAEALVREGFKTIKVRMAIREEGRDPHLDPSLAVMRAVRKAVGEDIALYFDPNEGYSLKRALQIGRQVHEAVGIKVYESPVAAHQSDALAEIARALPELELASGERLATRWAFRDVMLRGEVDVINPDAAVCGGLSEAKKIAALAESFDRSIAPHNARPTLLTAAHLHFLASCRNADRPQEHPGAARLAQLWECFEERIVPNANGSIEVPTRAGIGLTAIESRIRQLAQA
jgi:L-alanine-DL-glutamate epimerase-like enolase superfamily enzyme